MIAFCGVDFDVCSLSVVYLHLVVCPHSVVCCFHLYFTAGLRVLFFLYHVSLEIPDSAHRGQGLADEFYILLALPFDTCQSALGILQGAMSWNIYISITVFFFTSVVLFLLSFY